MGQLEKYGLYVLCLVIFLILGVAIWGGENEPATLPNESLPLHGSADGNKKAEEDEGLPAPRYSSAAEVLSSLLTPVDPPRSGRNLPPPEELKRQEVTTPPADSESRTAPTDASGRRVYTIRKGDILGEIAQRELGSSRHWKAILELNPGVDPKKLKPGQELVLPVPESLSVKATDASASSATAWRFHTVEKGESFYIISKKLYGTVAMTDEIQALNPRVDPRRLRAGMEIKVPIVR